MGLPLFNILCPLPAYVTCMKEKYKRIKQVFLFVLFSLIVFFVVVFACCFKVAILFIQIYSSFPGKTGVDTHHLFVLIQLTGIWFSGFLFFMER